MAAAAQLQVLTQRMSRNANELLVGAGVNPESAFSLGKDANTFRDTIDGLLNGSESLHIGAHATPTRVRSRPACRRASRPTRRDCGRCSTALPKLVAAKQAAEKVFKDSEPLRLHLADLRAGYSDGSSIYLVLAFVTGLLALVGALLIARSYIAGAALGATEARRGRTEAERQERASRPPTKRTRSPFSG